RCGSRTPTTYSSSGVARIEPPPPISASEKPTSEPQAIASKSAKVTRSFMDVPGWRRGSVVAAELLEQGGHQGLHAIVADPVINRLRLASSADHAIAAQQRQMLRHHALRQLQRLRQHA